MSNEREWGHEPPTQPGWYAYVETEHGWEMPLQGWGRVEIREVRVKGVNGFQPYYPESPSGTPMIEDPWREWVVAEKLPRALWGPKVLVPDLSGVSIE